MLIRDYTLEQEREDLRVRYLDACSLSCYPTREFTHSFVEASILNAFAAGFKAGVEAAERRASK